MTLRVAHRLCLPACTLFALFAAHPAMALTYYSRASGNWNDPACWSTVSHTGAAAASYPGAAAGDVVVISRHTITANVTPAFAIASITLNQAGSHASADTKLDLGVAGVVLTCNAFAMQENNLNRDVDLEISSTATLQVNGAATITRAATNTQSRRLRVYLRGSGVMNTTGNLTYTYHRSGGEGEQEILLSNSGRLNVGGNFSATIGSNAQGDDDFDVQVNNSAQLNVAGTTSLVAQNSTDGDDVAIDLNGGSFNSTGAMVLRVAGTCTGGSQMDVRIDGATLTAAGGLTCDQQNGDTYRILLNSNSTAVAAALNVTGAMTFSHSDGSDQEIELNTNSTLTVNGGMTMTFTENGTVAQDIDINGGTFTVTGDLAATINGSGNTHELNIEVDGNGHLNVNNDLTINAAEGNDLAIGLNANTGTTAQVNVGRDLVIDKDQDAGDVDIDLYENSALNVGRDLIGRHSPDNGDGFFIHLRDTPTLTIDRDLRLTMDSGNNDDDEIGVLQDGGIIDIEGDVLIEQADGDDAIWDQDGGTATVGGDLTMHTSGGDDTELGLDGNAQLLIAGSLILDMDAGEDLLVGLNENSGSGALLNVGIDLVVDHEGPAEDAELLLNNSSTLNIGGDLQWDQSDAGGDYARMRLDNDVNAVSIAGDMLLSLLTGTHLSDDFDYDQQGGTLTVAGGVTFAHAAGDDFYCHVHNSSVFDVAGDLAFTHTGGDEFKFDQSSNNSWVYVDGDVHMTDAAGGGTPTEYEQDNWSNSKVLGDFTITANGGNQCLVDMNNSAYMELGGSFVRGAAPNRYGSLTSSNGTTIEYDGVTNVQFLSEDAGDGGDGWDYEKVVIDNAFGTWPQVSTVGTTTIRQSLTLTDGVVYTEPTSLLVIANGTTSTGGSAASHVDGPMKKIGDASFTFPVGDNGRWARLRMENLNSANSGTEFVCEYFDAPSPNNSTPFYSATIDHVSFVEHWDLDRVYDTGSPASCQARLYWEDATSSGIIPANIADLRVAHFSGTTSKWENQGGTATGGAAGNVVSTTALVNFSPISFGSRAGNNPLPVELLEFEARVNGAMVDLLWTTATELNNDHFNVERSGDGISWAVIATVAGAGDSQELLHYAVLDPAPLNGVNFYRLEQVDIDGTRTLSDVRSVYFGFAQGDGPLVFPNPGVGDLNVALDLADGADVSFEVYNGNGQVVLRERHIMAGHSVVALRTAQLPAGSYQVVATLGGGQAGTARWLKVR